MSDEFSDVWSLCARLGIPSSPDTTRPGRFLWDGVTLHGRLFPPHPASRLELLHEIAHWISAESEHRSIGSFGFEGGEEPNPDQHLDLLAKLLGQLLAREAGRPHYVDQVFARSLGRSSHGRRAWWTIRPVFQLDAV